MNMLEFTAVGGGWMVCCFHWRHGVVHVCVSYQSYIRAFSCKYVMYFEQVCVCVCVSNTCFCTNKQALSLVF